MPLSSMVTLACAAPSDAETRVRGRGRVRAKSQASLAIGPAGRHHTPYRSATSTVWRRSRICSGLSGAKRKRVQRDWSAGMILLT